MVHVLEYVLDLPDADDLIQSFPVFLVSEDLGAQIKLARLTGCVLAPARISRSADYREVYGNAPHRSYLWLKVDGTSQQTDIWLDSKFRLCASGRAFKVLEQANLSGCQVTKVS